MAAIRTALKLSDLLIPVLVITMLGCADDDDSVQDGQFVCFHLVTNDWEEVGTFQQRFFADGDMVDGAYAVSLQIRNDENAVSVALVADSAAAEWIESLPDALLHDPSVASIEITRSSCLD